MLINLPVWISGHGVSLTLLLVIWVPDDSLRALDPNNDYGAKQVFKSLDQWDPTEWGLKAPNVSTAFSTISHLDSVRH